jgi:iron(III) transport system ATP-binding protein
VYVTHDQEEAMAVSDRIIVMKNAEIAQEGSPSDLYEAPNSGFIADFIGDANLAACEIETVSKGFATVRMHDKTYQIRDGGLTAGPAQMVLRPHHLRLAKPDTSGISGEVSYAAYLGKEIQYTVESALGPLFVISSVIEEPFRQGDAVSIQFDETHARLVAV